MTIERIVLEVEDTAAADLFHKALGVEDYVGTRSGDGPTTGFRGFTISLICAQPANVDALVDLAVSAGASVVKPATKSFWGYGGVVQSPDGTIWKVAASSKKNTAPAEAIFDEVVLLLGVADVKASKAFYVEHGLGVAKSYGGKYVELESGPVKLALYPRKANAKDAGVSPEGTGSHRLVIEGSAGGSFSDPDGYVWESR